MSSGVLFAVVQGLLHHAVHAGLYTVAKLLGDAFLLKIASDAAAALKIIQLILERRNQPQIVQ